MQGGCVYSENSQKTLKNHWFAPITRWIPVTIAMVAQLKALKTHRVLVVEDNEHVSYMLDFMLQRAGYDVIGVSNGRDAQAAISNIEPVDVVLLDLMLPYVSGYQLIEEIRKTPKNKKKQEAEI